MFFPGIVLLSAGPDAFLPVFLAGGAYGFPVVAFYLFIDLALELTLREIRDDLKPCDADMTNMRETKALQPPSYETPLSPALEACAGIPS